MKVKNACDIPWEFSFVDVRGCALGGWRSRMLFLRYEGIFCKLIESK